jgi:hypothetical protein
VSNANYNANFLQTEKQAKEGLARDAEAQYQEQKLQEFYKSENLKKRLNQSPIELEPRTLILPRAVQAKIDVENHLRTTEMQMEPISRLFNYDRTDIPSDVKLEMVLWLRQNTLVLCPHCKRVSNPAIRMQHPGFGITLCRDYECGQGFNAWDTRIMNLNGQELSGDDLPEKFREFI